MAVLGQLSVDFRLKEIRGLAARFDLADRRRRDFAVGAHRFDAVDFRLTPDVDD